MSDVDTKQMSIAPAALDEMQTQQAAMAREMSMKSLGGALLRVSSNKIAVKNVLKFGRDLREGKLWEYPYLPGAVQVFQQLASGREWVVSGKPRMVSRTVDWINACEVRDTSTGMTFYGYENFLRRRVLDYLTVGRTAFVVEQKSKKPVLEYLDPTRLSFARKSGVKLGSPVKPDEFVWKYEDNREFRARDIILDHPIPIGNSLFIAPIAPIIPTATMAWLLREHQTASLDGRKIRDIIFVSNPAIKNAMETAIHKVAAMWAGEDVSKIGLPIVEVNGGQGIPVADMFAMLGVSKMPDQFSVEEFIFSYVNEISGNLALALRHFYNSERTTNKALEEVQERRGQQKGPAAFVRTEQRLMNRPGILDHLRGDGSKNPRMGFVEETDASARLDNASILEKTTRALGQVAKVFGATIDPKSYLAWMQAINVLPNELKLVSVKNNAMVAQESDQSTSGDPEETNQESDPVPSTFDETASKYIGMLKDGPGYFLDYEEITMNGNGEVVDRRVKMFTAAKIFAAEKMAIESSERKTAPSTPQEAFTEAVEAYNSANRLLFQKFYDQIKPEIPTWTSDQRTYTRKAVNAAVDSCLKDEQLSKDQQRIIDKLVERFVDEPADADYAIS